MTTVPVVGGGGGGGGSGTPTLVERPTAGQVRSSSGVIDGLNLFVIENPGW